MRVGVMLRQPKIIRAMEVRMVRVKTPLDGCSPILSIRRLRLGAAALGLKTSCRASPGYGDWDVKEQKYLFELVPAERIGVTLTESSMMVPRKSVSFAVHIAQDPVRLRSEGSCRNCYMETCPYRIFD